MNLTVSVCTPSWIIMTDELSTALQDLHIEAEAEAKKQYKYEKIKAGAKWNVFKGKTEQEFDNWPGSTPSKVDLFKDKVFEFVVPSPDSPLIEDDEYKQKKKQVLQEFQVSRFLKKKKIFNTLFPT